MRGSAVIRELGRWVIPGAPIVIGYVALCAYSPWARFFAPAFGGLALLLLVTLVVLAVRRAPSSDLYYAKWIDLESRLEDRLASAVAWSALPERDPFQQRCVDQILLDLEAGVRPLVSPSTRPPRVALTAIALAAIAGALGLSLRPRAGAVERNAKQTIVLDHAVADTTGKQASALEAQAHGLQDEQLQRLSTDLSSLIRDINQGQRDRETTLALLEELRQKTEAIERANGRLGELAGGDQAGPVGELARALGQGDTQAAQQALAKTAQALAASGLDEQQQSTLVPSVNALAALADGIPDAALAATLHQAAKALRAGDQPTAGSLLAQASTKMEPLARPIGTVGALHKAEQTIAALAQATREFRAQGIDDDVTSILPPAAGQRPPGAKPDDGKAEAGSSGNSTQSRMAFQGSSGAGAQQAGEHAPVAAPPEAAGNKGHEVQLQGVWNGQIMRQLLDTSGAEAPSESAERLFVEHERVVEDRFRHDEVPSEYQDAIRTYFAALHQRESQWKQNRK